MLFKSINFFFLLIFLLLASCVTQPGASNKEEYATPFSTTLPEVFPAGDEENNIVLLLRSRERPFEMLVLSLSSDCLVKHTNCDESNSVIAKLPENLSQVSSLYWTNDSKRAFFWDENSTYVYFLDVNQGKSDVFKKEVLKVRDGFLPSPDGNDVVFEIQKGDHETDLVSMNVGSGDITKFDISEPCAKYVSQWMDANSFLFWCEKSEGEKGYLVDIEVYIFNAVNHSIQPFDIGRDWMQTSVPIFSPNRELMAFTAAGNLVIRDALTAIENGIDIMPEKFLWFTDSQGLIVYSQNKEFFTMKSDGSEMQKVYALLESEYLEDWIWLADSEHLLLITTNDDGNRQVGALSVVERTFNPIKLSLLNEYDPISFSFRP